MRKLWIGEYSQGKVLYLVPLYAQDEQDARKRAAQWAVEHHITTPPALRHYPHGFTCVFEQRAGRIEETP